MKILSICLSIIMLLQETQPGVDALYLGWNRATLADMKHQLQSVPAEQKEWYQNNIDALHSTGNLNTDSIDKESLRHTFLSHLTSRFPKLFDNFLVIEITTSGEIQKIFKFVLDISDCAHPVIYGYQYKGEWESIGIIKDTKLTVNKHLEQIQTAPQKGFNFEDVIVTRFMKGKVESSKYLAHFTLAEKSFVTDVLSRYISSYIKK